MDDYHFYEEVGRGSSSVVFKGRRKKTIEYVAIKSVDKAQMARVQNEVYIMHKLRHPNTLKFYNWYATRSHVWLILEYVTGGNLHTLLEQDKRLPESVIKVFGVDLMAGLHYMHATGILYCDLKPSNVLINEFGVLKLCDFGLSRKVPSRADDIKPGVERGTPCYMAPELFAADGVHSFSSDLWALGCVLYELYIGHPPFVSDSLQELVDLVTTGDLPLPAPDSELGMSSEFQSLLLALLDKDPQHRIGWDKLLAHPFWSTAPPPPLRPLPPQPQFAAFLERHAGDVLGSPRGSDGVPTWRPATQGQAQDHDSHAPAAKHARVRVDPLRVSSAVRDNLERDGEGGAGGKYSRAEAGGGEATGARLRASVKANGDVSLGDTDRELNFALQQARAALAATSGDGDGGDDDGEDEGEGAPGYDSGDEDEAGGGKAGEGDEGVWQPRSSPTMRAVTADGVSRQRQRPGAGAGSGAGAASDGMQPARPPGTAPGVFGGAATSKGDSGRRAAFDEDGVSTESADYWENLLATLPDGGAQSATIDQILLHPSDVVVSSIVCNPSIEAVVVPPVKTRLLQFDALPADKVAALARRPLEAHLNQVITGLASGNPTPDRLAVLSYCFILARSAAMANFIVNSSLMALFVRMLGQRKCPVPIRARVALVMGAAVRHATFISVSLQSARILDVLKDCARAKNHRLRRRAMGVLGELLFYVSTQDPADAAAAGAGHAGAGERLWSMPGWAVPMLAKSLESSDDVKRHYASKTLENVLAQSGQFGPKFATQEIGGSLLDLALHSRSQPLKCTASSALTHLFRRAPALRGLVLERGGEGLRFICEGVRSTVPQIQRAAINVLNLVLWNHHADGASAPLRSLRRQLLRTAPRSLLPFLLRVCEGAPSTHVCAKAMLSLALLIEQDGLHNPHQPLLVACGDKRLPAILDRVAGRRADLARHLYTAQCLRLLVEYLVRSAGAVVGQAANALHSRASHSATTGGGPAAGTPDKPLDTAAAAMTIVLSLLSSSLFRKQLVTDAFVEQLASCLHASTSSSGASRGPPSRGSDGHKAAELRRGALLVTEAMSQLPSLLVAKRNVVMSHLLPRLAVGLSAEAGDKRAWFTKLVCDTVWALLPGGETGPARALASPHHSEALQAFLVAHVVPQCCALLQDRAPMPQTTSRLLLAVVEWSPALVVPLHNAGVVRQVFQHLGTDTAPRARAGSARRRRSSSALEARPLSGTVVALVQRVVESQEVKEAELLDMGLVDRVASAFQSSVRESKWECCARLLDIVQACLKGVRDEGGVEGPDSPFAPWLGMVSTMCSVLLMDTSRDREGTTPSHSRYPPSASVAVASARGLLLLAHVFASQFCTTLVGGTYSPLADVAHWLDQAKGNSKHSDATHIAETLLKMLLICARLDESFVRAAVGHDSILSFAHSVARGQAGQYCNDGSMALADALVAALA